MYVIASLKLNFYDEAAKSVCLMLLCSKNEESYQNKFFLGLLFLNHVS